MKSPFKFAIGKGRWAEEIRYLTTELDPKYWSEFRAVSADEIRRIEREVNRALPEDFKEFLRVFGCGDFPVCFGGGIYTPNEMIDACDGHLSMIMGSSKWASAADQKEFYVSRGKFNPAPGKYTDKALMFEDVCLLDLLQIGTNGMGCYHQVYVGEKPNLLGYCSLTPEPSMEYPAPSFSEGLKMILTEHSRGDEDDPEEEDEG